MENAASRCTHLLRVPHEGGDTDRHHAGVHSSHLPPTLQRAEPCVFQTASWEFSGQLEWQAEKDLGLAIQLIHKIKC